MLFTIIKTGLQGRQFQKDPSGFVASGVKETALSILIIPVVIAIIILGLLFTLGFTELLGGPFGLAKFFFFILLIGYGLISIPIYFFYKLVKRASKKAGVATGQIFVKAEVIQK